MTVVPNAAEAAHEFESEFELLVHRADFKAVGGGRWQHVTFCDILWRPSIRGGQVFGEW